VNAQPNWWDTFFEGPAVAMWLQAIGPEQTDHEAERLARLLAIPAGAEVLDEHSMKGLPQPSTYLPARLAAWSSGPVMSMS
jgi:hypothetical protein